MEPNVSGFDASRDTATRRGEITSAGNLVEYSYWKYN